MSRLTSDLNNHGVHGVLLNFVKIAIHSDHELNL